MVRLSKRALYQQEINQFVNNYSNIDTFNLYPRVSVAPKPVDAEKKSLVDAVFNINKNWMNTMGSRSGAATRSNPTSRVSTRTGDKVSD